MKRTAIFLTVLIAFFAFSALAASKYEIEVDAANQIVTVYIGAGRENSDIIRQMICSTGRSNSTPKGTFSVFTRKGVDREEWYYIRAHRAYVQYPTRFYNDYLFHSVPYTKADTSMIDETALRQMGSPASHGCVRLYSEDAKWIAENCADGTKVHIYMTKETKEDLRLLLLDQTYAPGDQWKDYDEYLGKSDDPAVVSRSSDPETVSSLQALLKRWGYRADEPDGEYGISTRRAVMDAQSAAGLKANGLADPAFMEALESGLVPASTRVTLNVGDEGPAVAALQEALSEIGYYTGEIDGVYSEEFGETVKLYRAVRALGDGTGADEAVQLRAKEDRLQSPLPDGSRLVLTPVDAKIARFTRDMTLAMRTWRTEDSSFIRYVHALDTVWVLEPAEWGWVRVRVDGDEGYVKSSLLEFEDTVVYVESHAPKE